METWITVHTEGDAPNVIAGPFLSALAAMEFVSLDFDYTALSLHDSLESARADSTKLAFVPAP
jgi:hypothetical protein